MLVLKEGGVDSRRERASLGWLIKGAAAYQYRIRLVGDVGENSKAESQSLFR